MMVPITFGVPQLVNAPWHFHSASKHIYWVLPHFPRGGMTAEIRVVSTHQLLLADRQDVHRDDVCILTGANFFFYMWRNFCMDIRPTDKQ